MYASRKSCACHPTPWLRNSFRPLKSRQCGAYLTDHLSDRLARACFVVTKSHWTGALGRPTSHFRPLDIRTVRAQSSPSLRLRHFPNEAQMIAEVKQKYRGVLCRHCRQAIPLSQSAKRSETDFVDEAFSGRDEFTARSFTLRCRACDGEGLYTAVDVIDCDGTPRLRGPYASKRPPRVSKSLLADSSDLTKPPVTAAHRA